MAEKGQPWMRFHVTRWRNSRRVLKMSLAAQGAYVNLLGAAWQQGGRLPNDPDVLWKYAMAQSPQEFAAVSETVLAMFDVSKCGQWLTNHTLSKEFRATKAFTAKVSRKRSEAGKKGGAARWNKGFADQESNGNGIRDGQIMPSQDLPSPNLPSSNQLMANAWHKTKHTEQNKTEHTEPGKTGHINSAKNDSDQIKGKSNTKDKSQVESQENSSAKDTASTKSSDKTIEVAHWKCVELGLASQNWKRPTEAMNAFDAALQNEQRNAASGSTPARPLTDIADELGNLWLEYTRSAKGTGQFAMGPAKFFGEGWYRRTAAWRDPPTEPMDAVDGAAFIEEKRRKREAADAARQALASSSRS